MGKASRKNDAGYRGTYQRNFVISAHAVERFRQRVEKEHAALSDYDIGNLLDERIRQSERHQTVVDTRNIESVTRVFEIQHRDQRVYYAVVRDMTVVTVLDEDMLRVNFDNGSWKTGPMNMPFNKTTLRGVVPEENAIKHDPRHQSESLDQCLRAAASMPEPEPPKLAPIPSTPVHECALKLGDAMVEYARASHVVMEIQAEIDDLTARITEAVVERDARERDVAAAQTLLTAATTELAKGNRP